ncbi:MAG: hypothetical protein FWG11_02625, partial [Promicromonosporaceae bacterium]|nr:hypothetical protein [Promicromonosporaceae bacterium]
MGSSSITVLDCTLRDGGYVNSFKFGRSAISRIVAGLVDAKADYIEVGFLGDGAADPDYSLFGSDTMIDEVLPADLGSSVITAMIAVDNIELDPQTLRNASDSNLGFIRITFHGEPAEIAKAIDIARVCIAKGYKVSMQPVGTAGYSDEVLLDIISQVNELRPFSFYIVDTLGELYGHELLRLLHLFDHNLDPSIALGFHAHNNLQLALSNAIVVTDFAPKSRGREFILDATVFGMGRGAGN